MKKIILIVALLLSVKAYTQNFEGTIKWSMKVNMSDAQKAQLEEAQKRMSDPATQAQMKQMMEKMNDPQFKAMLENNPQMKAQIEKIVQGMQSGDVNSVMPKGLTVKIKNKNVLTTIDGGMLASEFLYLNDKEKAYNLDRKNKTYSVLSAPSKTDDSKSDTDVKVTKTSEKAKILNYTCVKYIAEITSGDTKVIQNIWATTEIKDFDLKALSKQHFGKSGQRMFYENIDGVPLKMDMKVHGADIVMEVVEIKKESLQAADFIIPPDFKETPGL
jgi:hypothetical protein